MSSNILILRCFFRISEVVMQAIVFLITLLMLSYSNDTIGDMGFVTCLYVTMLPVFVLYLARQRIHNGVLLLLLHIGAAVFFTSIGNTLEEKMAYLIMGTILIIYSVSLCIKKKKTKSEKMPIGVLALFIVAVIMGDYLEADTLSRTGLYCGEVFLMLQIIYHNFSNMNDYIEKNNENTTLPVKQMVQVNAFLMTILVTLGSGVMQLFKNSYITKMVKSIGSLLKEVVVKILRFLLSLLVFSEEKPAMQKPIKEEGLEEIPALLKDSIWTDILNGIEVVLKVTLIIALVIVVTVGIVMWIVTLVRKMSSSESKEDMKEFILPKEIKEFQLRRIRRIRTEKTSNAKVRKLYQSIVMRNATKSGSKIDDSMVPCVISKLYIHIDPNTVTDIYEKARYSNQEVTKQELEVLKKCRKGWSL